MLSNCSLQPVTTNGEVLGAHRDRNSITLDGVDVNDNQNAGLVAQNTTTGNTYQGVNGNAAVCRIQRCCRSLSIPWKSSALP